MDEIISKEQPIVEPILEVTPKKKLPIWVWIMPIFIIIAILIAIIFKQQQLLKTNKQEEKISNGIIQTAESTHVVSPTIPPVSEATASTENSDWKIYKSEMYGFEFKYPNSWKFNEQGGNNFDLSVVSIVNPEKQNLNNTSEINELSVYYYNSVMDEPENVSKVNRLEEMIEKNVNIKKIGSLDIGGVSATDVIWGGYSMYYTILVTKNSHLYKIFFENVNSKDMLTPVHKTILSTFKFTK